jgi:hypothetical protein
MCRTHTTEKTVIVESRQTPEQPGYLDTVVVANKVLLWHGTGSTCPNPTRPWPRHGTGWRDAYGWIACGDNYVWECCRTLRHGLCLVVNAGREVPARYPNANHGGRPVLTSILIHKGWSATWRGSAGCLTIPPDEWHDFISVFKRGDCGRMAILDCTTTERRQPTWPAHH